MRRRGSIEVLKLFNIDIFENVGIGFLRALNPVGAVPFEISILLGGVGCLETGPAEPAQRSNVMLSRRRRAHEKRS